MIKIKRSDKRGSHVEIIISFVVFVTFLIFLFLILEPSLGLGEDKEAAVESAEADLIDYLSSELTTITVWLAFEPGETCLQINDLIALGETGLSREDMFVKDALGNNLDFNWSESGNALKVENLDGNRFFKIYASDGIKSQTTNFNLCEAFPTTDYTPGLIKKERYISEQNVIDAITLYKINYNSFKDDLGLAGDDIGFDFVYGNGTIISTGEIGQIPKIYTKRITVNYFDKNLNIDMGSIIIKVW